MNSWQIQPLHLSGHPKDLQNQQDASPSIPIKRELSLLVFVWQVCVLLPEAAADPRAAGLRKEMAAATFPEKPYQLHSNELSASCSHYVQTDRQKFKIVKFI